MRIRAYAKDHVGGFGVHVGAHAAGIGLCCACDSNGGDGGGEGEEEDEEVGESVEQDCLRWCVSVSKRRGEESVGLNRWVGGVLTHDDNDGVVVDILQITRVSKSKDTVLS